MQQFLNEHEIFKSYLEYFNHRDIENLLKLFDDNAYSLGSEKDEKAFGKEEIRKQHEDCFNKYSYLQYNNANILKIGENYIVGELKCFCKLTANSLSKLTANEEIKCLDLRVTLVIHSNKISHLHASEVL
jgi:hypothetical protein